MFSTIVEFLFLLTQCSSVTYSLYIIAQSDFELFLRLTPLNYVYYLFFIVSKAEMDFFNCFLTWSFIYFIYSISNVFTAIRCEGDIEEDDKHHPKLPTEQHFFVYYLSYLQLYLTYIYRTCQQTSHILVFGVLISYCCIILLNHATSTFDGEEEEEEEIEEEDDEKKEQVKKVFKNYPNLPPELQMMIIDEMKPKDRFKFSECSKVCIKQVQDSRHYINELEYMSTKDYTRIRVLQRSNGKNPVGYKLTFKNEFKCNYISCENLGGKVLWVERLDKSKDIDQHALQHFKDLLKLHQYKIHKLSIKASKISSEIIDFEVRNLRNLEQFSISCNTDVQKLLSRTSEKLTTLIIPGKNVENFEEIYHVQKLDSSDTQLNNEQFLRLSASEVRINIGSLTEQDIFNFIQSWKKGTIGKEIKRYEWIITNSQFNVATVFDLCGGYYDESHSKRHEIEHEKRIGSKAGLSCHEFNQEFRILSFVEIVASQE